MKKFSVTVWIVFVVILLNGVKHVLPAQVFEQDSLALVAFYESTNGAEWDNNTNWLSGPVSSWHGITIQENRVIDITLNWNNLKGSIPPEIGALSSLRELTLYGNELSGEIPPEIGNLLNLTYEPVGLVS
ncbi:hypothetical protein JW935_10130 [candidate division KSB1 bacterium]|nr:hypothetical protein [candidate division KSB1 bacterium]